MERAHKMRPVHTAEEREEILRSLRNVDDVVYYHTENQFHDFLKSGEYDMRFLGSDYIDGSYTGIDIHIPIVWLSRDHGYSTTKLKTKIYQSIENFKREDYD
jgi:glycerol-3-phosphate cytidylyltransferase-like family protein